MTTWKKLFALWPRLLLLIAILAVFAVGMTLLFVWLTQWEHRLLFLLVTFSVTVTFMMLRDMSRPAGQETEAVEPIPDAASAEEQQAALEQLASLPQFRRLDDGTVFDYLQGNTVSPCRCGQYSPFHLLVNYGKGRRHAIALVTRSALAQYLAVQTAVGSGLRRQAPQSSVPVHPAGGGR